MIFYHSGLKPVDNNKQILQQLWIFQGLSSPNFNLQVSDNYLIEVITVSKKE